VISRLVIHEEDVSSEDLNEDDSSGKLYAIALFSCIIGASFIHFFLKDVIDKLKSDGDTGKTPREKKEVPQIVVTFAQDDSQTP